MRNKKVIVINGFPRGGSNIIWNIMQSHPLVCSPISETGAILSDLFRFKSYIKLTFFIKRFKRSLYWLLKNNTFLESSFVSIMGKLIDKLFYKYKMKTLIEPYNRFKYENLPYNKKEVKNSVLCLKSLNEDIELTNFFLKIYKNIFFVGLIRNGYALCEGWNRRGLDAKTSGLIYRKYCEKIIKDSKNLKNYLIVKFEEIIKNPFIEATKLYEFTQLNPTILRKLRLKSKRLLTREGNHKVKFGEEHKKYWFNAESITDYLNPEISEIQTKKLSNSDRKIFEKEAKPILKYFNYLN
ncbi:MAG: hypothetical protein ACFFAN_09020 [Promethearchaeota archaeon]